MVVFSGILLPDMFVSKYVLIGCTVFFISLAFITATVGMQAIQAMKKSYALQIEFLSTLDNDTDGINDSYDASF